MDPLHPYDNQTRTFQHTDAPARHRDGLALVARLLRWPTPPAQAWYHMSFYSGGCGIFDRIQLAVPLEAALLSCTLVSLKLRLAIAEAAPELCWLMGVEEATPAGRWAAAQEWVADDRICLLAFDQG